MYQTFEESKLKCRDCFIGKVYDRVVPSDGNKVNPIVLIIGEAPGKDEVSEGFPFVGKAGKLLRRTLNKFGFNKKNALITNTIPCRPQDNKFPKDNDIIKSCVQKWLLQEIVLTSPKYIMLVGATPTRFLLGLTGITKLRGQWHDLWFPNHPSELNSPPDFNKIVTPDFGRLIKCMPIYHPSYVLRKEYMDEGDQIREEFIGDIKEVAKIACFTELKNYN